MKSEPAANYASFPGSNGIRSLEAQFPPKLIYEFQNIHEGTFRIADEDHTPDFQNALPNEANYKLVDLAQIDLEGESVPGKHKVNVELVHSYYKAVQQKGVAGRISTRYDWIEEVVEETEVSFSGEMGTFTFLPKAGGDYQLNVHGEDHTGQPVLCGISFYATGGRWIRYAGQKDDDIKIEPDRELYFPGDTARLLVRSPVEEGRYLLTVEREGILEERFVDIGSDGKLPEIPIKESYVPVMYVSLTGFQNRTTTPASYFEPDFGKPKGLFGTARLTISTRARELDFEIVRDRKLYRPGDKESGHTFLPDCC